MSGEQVVGIVSRDRFNTGPIMEVLSTVEPKGVCRFLDLVRPRRSTTKQDSTDYALLGTSAERSLKPYIESIFLNTGITKLLASKGKGEELNRGEIKQALDITNAPMIDRLYYTLNHSMDPELLPAVLDTFEFQGQQVPRLMVNAIAGSDFLKQQFMGLLTDQVYINEILGFTSRHRDQGFSESVLNKLNHFINTCLLEAGKYSHGVTRVDILEARSYMEDFFHLNVPLGTPASPFLQFEGRLARITGDTYFEHCVKTPDRGKVWFSGIVDRSQSSIDWIKLYAQNVERGRYLTMLHNKVTSIYAQFFPEIYVDAQISKLEMTDPNSSREGYNQIEEDPEFTQGSFDPQTNSIRLNSGTAMRIGGEDAFSDETFWLEGAKRGKFRRRIADAVTMAHEYTHAIFEKLVLGKDKREGYSGSAASAINEGFAVFMELLFEDVLKANPELLGLDQRDIKDLDKLKEVRLSSLKKYRNHYTEGTFKILHKIFRTAAGTVDVRDAAKGIHAIRDFIGRINPETIINIKRTDPVYQQALKSGDPETLLRVFS